MKKSIFAGLFVGLLLQTSAFAEDNFLYKTISIPEFKVIPSVENGRSVKIEQNEYINEDKDLEIDIKPVTQTGLKTERHKKVVDNIYHPISEMLGKYKNPVKIVYTDIDGIILNSNETNLELRDSVRTGFAKLKEAKIPVVFTTDRTYREAKRIAETLEITPSYYITQNGAEIIDSNGNIIYEHPIGYGALYKVDKEVKWFNYFYGTELQLAFYDRGKVYVYGTSSIPNLVDVPTKIDRFSQIPKTIRVSQVRVYDRNEKNLDIFKRYLQRHYKLTLNIDDVSDGFVDINSRTATKDRAVEYLSGIIHTGLKNSAVFGYSNKDIKLMTLVRENGGLSISNEASMQDVKDESSYITKDVDNDGFKFAVDNILGNNMILGED